MKNRWSWFAACAAAGLVMLVCGLLVPAHLRSVDASVLASAGKGTPAFIDQALKLADSRQLGPARLLLAAAEQERLPRASELRAAVGKLAAQNPALVVQGAPGLPFPLASSSAGSPTNQLGGHPVFAVTELLIQTANRERALALLGKSGQPASRALLQTRFLTNTVIFPPSESASGQAFDAALALCGLLLRQGALSASLSNAVVAAAGAANRGAPTQPFEQALLDLLSLGQRFDWGQLAALTAKVRDLETLRLLGHVVRQHENQLPLLFAAVQFSGKPAEVTRYLMTFSQTGLSDLGASFQYGAGGINQLLETQHRFFSSSLPFRLFPDWAWQQPWLTLAFKWLLYFGAGFLLAAAVHQVAAAPFAPLRSGRIRPVAYRGTGGYRSTNGGFRPEPEPEAGSAGPNLHVPRQVLFGLGFLLVVLLFSEPFLAQESQRVEFPFRLRVPMVGTAFSSVINNAKPSIMNQLSLLTLLLFFVLQALIYTACLVKLSEIRRQNISSRIKLKLLENEDHLFDAGLYLGFVGTIISLILVSLGVIKPSLMAAYSSTSFGIIFVSIFKIFHLRPLRRRLLLDAELQGTESAPAAARVASVS